MSNLRKIDKVSRRILELLTEFSDYINQTSVLNDILLTNNIFNKNPKFIKYIYSFDLGRYYHFRCMGYMESLVLMRCYSIKGLCYWKNELVMPAYENLTEALKLLDELKLDDEIACNPIFKILICETEELKKIAMEIMDTIKYYNLPC